MERSKTRRVNKSSKKVVNTTISDLPYSILGDIFSRLPIIAILSCRRVCQSWCNLFLVPDNLLKSLPESFILRSNKHPRRIHPRKLCLFDLKEAFSPTTRRSSDSDSDSVRDRKNLTISFFWPDFGIPTMGDFELVNSCNGFLCLCDSQSQNPTYILNPITGEYIKLPSADPKNQETNDGYVVSRFGFSPKTNQYKVIRQCNKTRTEIYTLGTRTWRRIEGQVVVDLPYAELAKTQVLKFH